MLNLSTFLYFSWSLIGGAENAGRKTSGCENDAPSIARHEIAGHKNAGRENDGPSCRA